MAAVTIKGREEKLQIIISEVDPFACVMKELHNKLDTMQRLSQAQPWEAFFAIPKHYNEEQLFQVLQSVSQYGGVVAGFEEDTPVSPYDVWQQDVRSGEHHEFTRPTIIFGNIHADAFVVCWEDLFVMGRVEGSVTMKSKHAEFYAMSLLRANLQLFDEIRPNLTSFSPVKRYHSTKEKQG